MSTETKYRSYDFESIVKKAEGDEYNKKDVAYEFSNGRKFEDTGANSGIYEPS